MITLDYKLAKNELSRLENMDWSVVNSTDLDYYLFKGNLIFRINETSFDAEWGWIPIVDFATRIYTVAINLMDGESQLLEFTESDAGIQFERRTDFVHVNSNYSSIKGQVNIYEFRQSASDFLNRVLTDFGKLFPDLLGNVFFQERFKLLRASENKS